METPIKFMIAYRVTFPAAIPLLAVPMALLLRDVRLLLFC